MSLENYSVDQIQELASLADSLAKNPKTRESFLRLTKTASPDTPIPEIDLKDQMRAYAKPLIDKVASLEQQMQSRQWEDKVTSKRNVLFEQGFKKEEVDQIEKMMLEKQIPSHETAAEFFRMQKQTATPTPHTMTPISLPTNAFDKMKSSGQTGLNQWSRGEAMSAISDVISGRAGRLV
jgi:hypothetical protein